MSRPNVVTLGCRLNTFESQVIRQQAEAAGMKNAVVVNTCAVTAEATRQARQAIRKLRRENPDARIIVTGCAAQLDPERFAAMPEVDRVVGNELKLDGRTLFEEAGGVCVTDVMTLRETAGHLLGEALIGDFGERTRAFVQVQQGCDWRCTFCIIPFARGPNRSVAPKHVVEQVKQLATNGYAEVVLTGVDLCSYGAELPGRPRLGDLATRILDAVPALRRLRLSSLDPAAMDDEIFRLLADEPRLMPHLHLSLQAADDLVLKRMKRRHSRAQALEVCARAREARPDVALGADLIAGFPTETEAMFETTLRTVEAMDLPFLHVFPYSARPGTPAARMPQVPVAERKARAARLREAGARALARFLEAQIGTTREVLAETGSRGLTPHYAPVELDSEIVPGRLVSVRIEGMAESGNALRGRSL